MLKNVTIVDEALDLFYYKPKDGIYYSRDINDVIYVKEHLYYIYGLDPYTKAYGTCDNFEQVLNSFDFEDDPREIVIFLTRIEKKDQPVKDGFRMSKWGDYLGDQLFQGHEYLYDEPNVEWVYLWEAWEVGEIEKVEENIQ